MGLYNRKNIFNFLKNGFSLEELHNLCFHSNYFNDVYDDWERVEKSKFIRELISTAMRKRKVKELLEDAGDLNPHMYETYKSYYSDEVENIALNDRRLIDNFKQFFNLSESNSSIDIYLSRHSVKTQLPIINVIPEHADSESIVNTLYGYQQWEEVQSEQSLDNTFAAVSAIEMLEAHYLKEEIEQLHLRELFPEDMVKEILGIDPITVNLGVCPEPINYEELVCGNGTVIFIGGPRANLGTYYYLYGYGSEAATVRPRRIPKNIIECINNPAKKLKCDENHNLAIIQKHKIVDQDKTIFYLAGTGANGTAAAIAYLRQSWVSLLYKYEDNFAVIIEVTGGKTREEHFSNYNRKYWRANHGRGGGNTKMDISTWVEVELPPD